MASTGSSLSQESLDIEDYDVATRRSRQRPLRNRVVIHKYESIETTDDKDLEEELDSFNDRKENMENFAMYSSLAQGGATGEHESPTRGANRQKDKRGRLNHLHKGKTAKDKRKLREKRRSTGVVHLASTEVHSTGDSLDEVEGKEAETQTRRNTSYNEVIDADNPQTPEEERKAFSARNVRNKSPSDLDADLEDNQDYDSTVSQSETNLTTIGQTTAKPVTGPTHFHMEAPPEVLRPSTHTNHAAQVPPIRAASFPAPTREDHPHHKHHLHRSAEGRAVSVHFREAELSNGDRIRAASSETGGMFKRTCTTHDGMEARLLAKTVELEKILEKEREEKRHLQELLDERDLKIAQLESQLSTLNKIY